MGTSNRQDKEDLEWSATLAISLLGDGILGSHTQQKPLYNTGLQLIAYASV